MLDGCLGDGKQRDDVHVERPLHTFAGKLADVFDVGALQSIGVFSPMYGDFLEVSC